MKENGSKAQSKEAEIRRKKQAEEDKGLEYNLTQREPTRILENLLDCPYQENVIAVKDGWVYIDESDSTINTTFSAFEYPYDEYAYSICDQTKRNAWNNKILIHKDEKFYLLDTSEAGNSKEHLRLSEDLSPSDAYYLPEIDSVLFSQSDGLNYAYNVCLLHTVTGTLKKTTFEGQTTWSIRKAVVRDGEVYLLVEDQKKLFRVYDFTTGTLKHENVSSRWPDLMKPLGDDFKKGHLLDSTETFWAATKYDEETGKEKEIYFWGHDQGQKEGKEKEKGKEIPASMYPKLDARDEDNDEGYGLKLYFGTSGRFALGAHSTVFLFK